MWKRYIVRQHKRMCCNVSFAPSHLFALCVQYTARLWFSLWLLLSLFGLNWRCKKKQMLPITHITCRQSGWLHFAVCNADIWFYVPLHLCVLLCFLCVGLSLCSLSSLDLFICWLLSPPPSPSFYIVCPHDSQYGDSIPHQLIVFCPPSSLASPTAVYPAPSPDTDRLAWFTVFFLLYLPPLWTPLRQQSCQIKITALKIQSTLPPTNSKGLLVGYSCIQVYIVSWWRCFRSPTWQFHQNVMYSFIVTSKLYLFADNRDVYQGQESRRHMQIGFLSDKLWPCTCRPCNPC